MVEDLELRAVELLRPVAGFAGFSGGAQIVDGRGNGSREGVERGLDHLPRAGEFGFDVPGCAGADVAIDAGDAGVRRLLIGGELGRHDGVAELSAETDGVGEVVGLVAADHAHADENHDEGQEEGDGAALRGIGEVEAKMSGSTGRMRGADGGSRSAPKKTSTRPSTKKAGATM